MVGGLLILVNSKYNNHLVNFPQMSFFKSVYRKYTNFSIESRTENIDKKTLQTSEVTKLTFQIPRYADLLNGIYLNFSLPSIYSGNDLATKKHRYNFKWIKNIGTNLIKEAVFYIDGVAIDTLYYEWLNIYYELYYSTDEKELFDKMSGNIKDNYEPEYSDGHNGQYPHITSGVDQYNKYSKYSGFNILNINDIDLDSSSTVPSIVGRDYRVKLPFWFSTLSALAFPLCAVQYSNLEIELHIAPIYDLYTVIDVRTDQTSFGKRVKCTSSSDSILGIQNFINDSSIVSKSGSELNTVRVLNNLDLNISLELDYVFLDDEERNKFALYSHEYLIERHTPITNISDNTLDKISTSIDINNLVKYMVVLPKRNDSKNINNWNNYTSWIDENIPPYSSSYEHLDEYYDTEKNQYPFFTYTEHSSNFNMNNFKKNIINKIQIKFAGNNVLSKEKNNLFFEYQQPLNYFKKNRKSGIYVYSFSLEPLEYQPSGACNFSNIDNAEIDITFNNPSTSNLLSFDVTTYMITYNILSIKSGCAALKYGL